MTGSRAESHWRAVAIAGLLMLAFCANTSAGEPAPEVQQAQKPPSPEPVRQAAGAERPRADSRRAASRALFVGGLTGAIVGIVLVGGTAIGYDEEMSSSDFARLRALNTAGWGLGAAGFGAVVAGLLLPTGVVPVRTHLSIGWRANSVFVSGRF